MFLDYYRLSESPFADASDPRFLYFGPTTARHWHHCTTALSPPEGFWL